MSRHVPILAAALILPALFEPSAAEGDPFALLFGDVEEIDASTDDRPGEDDLRFVGLRLGGLKLKDTATAYARPEGLCLLADGLFEHLDAPVEVTDIGASGWFISPERTIEIDVAGASAVLGGDHTLSLDGELFQTPEGWCLVESAWSRLLPIDFTYRPASLALHMEPREILPIQARLERQDLRDRLNLDQGSVQPDYRKIDNPYRWMTWPTADISLDIRASDAGGTKANSQVELSGDVLWTTARLRSAQSASGDMGLRVSFDRVTAHPNNSWTPTQVRLGDVTGPSQPLVSRTQAGRGLILTNRPAYAADVFDHTDIRGALPVGWEAELYRETQLIDFVTEPDGQGEYLFENVEILPGYNRFTVKLFGPYGETDTREVKFFAGSEMHPENEVQYDISLVQQGVSVDGDENGEPVMVASASVGFGLTENITSTLDVRSEVGGETAVVASAIGAYGSTHGVVRLGTNTQSDARMEAGVVHLFEDRSVLDARYVRWGDGEEAIDGSGGISQSATLQYDTLLPITGWGLPFKARLDWDAFAGGGDSVSASARFASSFQAWRWSSVTRLESRSNGEDRDYSLGGGLNATRNLGGLRLRSGIAYDIGPQPKLRTVDVALQKRFEGAGFAQWTLARDMETGRTQSALSYAHEFRNMTLSASAGIDDSGSWSAGLRVSTALFFDKRDSRYRTAPPGLSRTGAIRANVFDDLDENSTFNAEDRSIEGASFILDRSIRREETAADGSVVMGGVQAHRPLDLELSLGSLDDPFLQAQEPGLAVTVRPGQVIDVDVPLTLTGEADAMVTLIQDGHESPVAGVLVEAVNGDGHVVARASSEYDGYVYLDGLPMGDLDLRVAPDALDGIGAVAAPVSIMLTRDEPSTFGAALVIERE